MRHATRKWLPWVGAAALAALLPLVFAQGFAVSLFCQMGIAIIFALSYNMLLGGTGMLSFGHAVYYGMGAFFCAHVLNLMASKALNFPVSLLPLIGGLTGAAFGVVFGYVTTKRSGTPFAMISLGIGEMVAACSLMFPGFFGGEGGISANRVVGAKWLGLSYGPQIQVYYLIAVWALICAGLMYAFTRTPLGRMANAVRDNAERVEFVGYDPQRVRYLVFIIASFFAGVAGGLAAINYELVTAESLGVQTSGTVLLMAYIGGIGFFYGPIIGALLVTFLQIALSGYTKAWLLYFGLFFLIMVLFAPGGLASLIEMHRPLWRAKLTRRLLPSYAQVVLPLMLALVGIVGAVEMLYQVEAAAGAGSEVSVAGLKLDADATWPWALCALLVSVGTLWFIAARPRFAGAWETLHQRVKEREAR